MSKTDELKKLAQKITGETPSGRRASNVVEFIADKISGDTENTNTISESISYLAEVYEPTPPAELQEKEVTITENGTTTIEADEGYDGLSSVEVTTNITGGNAVLDFSLLTSSTSDYGKLITELKDVTIPNVTGVTSFKLNNCTNLTKIGKITLGSNYTSMSNTFNGCSYLKSIESINTENIQVFNATFEGCSRLENLPILDFRNVTSFNNQPFRSLSNLTDTSIQNLAKSLLTLTEAYTGAKTLVTIGITNSTVQRKMQELPEWTTLSANGWTVS